MRVLHVVDISIPTLAGYTSRTRYIVTTQKALSIEPFVLSSIRQQNDKGCSMEEIGGIRHHRTLPPLPASLAKKAEDTPVAKEAMEINHLRQRIVQVARREKPDIIHAHSSILCGIPAYLASRQLGIPCVYEIRAFWEDAAVDSAKCQPGSPRYVATQKAETALAKQVDALIGICGGIKHELTRRGIDPSRVHVVPNGVDTERFVPIPRDRATEARYGLEGKTVVGYIGTFARFEGVRFLIEALIRLHQSGRKDIKGLIVGSGPTYESCRARAKEAGLEQEILHPGRVPHDEITPMYSVVDILAYPRDRQRITELVTPLKPLEAMAMEKAVIGSDVGGLTELIDDGVTGLIHQAENVDDLADKIRQLADDPQTRTRLGQSGRAHVTKNRQWRAIIENHFNVYRAAHQRWQNNRTVWKWMAKLGSSLSQT